MVEMFKSVADNS